MEEIRQTRNVESVMFVRTCGFKSHRYHSRVTIQLVAWALSYEQLIAGFDSLVTYSYLFSLSDQALVFETSKVGSTPTRGAKNRHKAHQLVPRLFRQNETVATE